MVCSCSLVKFIPVCGKRDSGQTSDSGHGSVDKLFAFTRILEVLWKLAYQVEYLVRVTAGVCLHCALSLILFWVFMDRIFRHS